MHIIQGMTHKGMDQSAPRVFGVGGDTGNAAYIHDRIVDIDFHGIDDDHGCQFILIEPSENVGLLQNGALGVFDLFLFPSGLKQIIGGDLKSVLQQGIKLLQIAFVQFFSHR